MLHERLTTGAHPPAPQPARSAFGHLVRSHRQRAGLTQQALAAMSTISARTIRDLESGRARARTQTILLLAEGLQLRGRSRGHFIRTGTVERIGSLDPGSIFWVPELTNEMLGRDLELRTILDALTTGRRRLICLCGLPGVGKTRLAAEIARTLSTQRGWPVTWVAASENVLDGLHPEDHQDALVVLDDVREPSGAAAIAPILAQAPGIRVISTSRRPLHLLGANPIVLSPLATPGPDQLSPGREGWGSPSALAPFPAMLLLAERAVEVRPGFTVDRANAGVVATVCRRSDGLPLVLEILAGSLRVLSLDQLAAIPAGDLLALSVPARPGRTQGSIGDLFASSLERLRPRQQAILLELARSDRSWTVQEVAVALTRPLGGLTDDLGVLIGHGLIGTTTPGPNRTAALTGDPSTQPGDPSTRLAVPSLLRAFLAR